MKLVDLHSFTGLGTPPAMLVEEILPERSLVQFIGEPYVGKSLIALELALAVAQGGLALGKWQAREAKVVYVGLDAPTWYLAWQTAALVRGRFGAAEPPEGRMWFVPRTAGARVLDSDQAVREFISQITDLGAELVVLDTLRKMHVHNENDSGLMTQVVDRARWINDEGAAVLLVHHAGKASKEDTSPQYRGRGSTVVPGEVDVQWLVEKRSHASRVTVVKGRGTGQTEPFDLVIRTQGLARSPQMRVEWQVAAPDPGPALAPAKRGYRSRSAGAPAPQGPVVAQVERARYQQVPLLADDEAGEGGGSSMGG